MANDVKRTAVDHETNIRQGIEVIQSMIDISADRLEALRTQCATSAELTQQEIRTLETKLVKMFSELLITKAKLSDRWPKAITSTGAELKQWLRVVGKIRIFVHALAPLPYNSFVFSIATLQSIGLGQDSLHTVLQRVNTLEVLLDKSDCELRGMLNQDVREEEVRRFLRAIFNLKRCRDAITVGTTEPNELFWDSWDRHHNIQCTGAASPRTHRSTSRFQQHQARMVQSSNGLDTPIHTVDISIRDGSQPSHDTADRQHFLISPEDTSASTLTSSPSPPNSPANLQSVTKRGVNSTPPARKRHQTVLPAIQQPGQSTAASYQQQHTPPSAGSATEQALLPKCGSPESLWSSGGGPEVASTASTIASMATPPHALARHSIPNMNGSSSVFEMTSHAATANTSLNPNLSGSASTMANLPTPRSRLHTEPSPDSFNDMVDNGTLNVPRSPCTPLFNRGMGHAIAHRFTKKFNVMYTCNYCNKSMFFGLKCKECKYRCHKECEPYVPPSCGLPTALFVEFKRSLNDDLFPNTSPSMIKATAGVFAKQRKRSSTASHGPDSSSAGSSCNSSSPSSPAMLTVPLHTPASSSRQTQFHFPDAAAAAAASPVVFERPVERYEVIEEATEPPPPPPKSPVRPKVVIRTQQSLGLTETTRSNGSDRTDKTVSLSGSISASTDSVRSDEERGHGNWPRQNSLSLKEWDIPFEDLKLLEEIGRGRFGTVNRGLWHGDVAVKIFNEGYLDDERALEAFKLGVATFKKTRHENLVLFMGFCMKPQAIVTSLCKGNTLYTHIHSRRDKFNLYRAILVAQQISQGMGYLHAKEIVHKDLKTKNIFLENGKVIITDFGLFSTTKLKYTAAGLFTEENSLCYLAPELIRQLRAIRPAQENLPFSKASDVFAFGTIWYELICGEFPFKGQPVECTIYRIGRGMKYTLANVQASRDVKDIIMVCSAFQPDDRPDFAKILALLERLPKKRLARSPSHPVQLSRSAESVF